MAYITDTQARETFPCNTVGITQQQITVNMNSRTGFLNLSRGGFRNGQYTDNQQNVFNIDLPGEVVEQQQQLTFNRQ